MLCLYQSNLTENLLSGLSQVIAHKPKTISLLEPEQILVQNPDMAQWLKMELAEQQGIAANLKFPLPSSFLWQIFHALFSEQLPEESPFGKEKITLHLMALLPELRELPDFSWLQPELFEPTDEAQLKLYQLCGSIADTFDQYLMYRPDWISTWEQGEANEGEGSKGECKAKAFNGVLPESQQWQPLLWQHIAQTISKQSGCELHRGRLLQQTIEQLNTTNKLQLKGLPQRISIFGISSMPEQMVLLLNALAKHIDIHWFQLNPCQEFWLDIIDEKTKAKIAANSRYIHLDDLEADRYFLVGNPLLASMGQLGREHLSLLFEQLEGDWQEAYDGYPTTGALGLLQGEVLNLSCRGQFESLTPEQIQTNRDKFSLTPEQLSNIGFHSCYSPMREMEVLKDQLLAQFEADSTLTPNDVLVMMPDVGRYAPFIEALFSERPGEPYLAYSINDLSAVQESPLIDSFLHLLNLPESRLKASELLSLLEVPAVLRRFNLDESELETIKHWLQETGVRWGRDEQQRHELGLGEFASNSWAFGLKRMLTGYAMHSELGVFNDSLPYDEIEGQSAATLGKLLSFIDVIDLARTELSEHQSALAWSQLLTQLSSRLYLTEAIEQVQLQGIFQSLEKLALDCERTGYALPLGHRLIQEYLSTHLNLSQRSHRFKAGAINFCTLMPMRNIPFKVVCLLGMGDGEFPRSAIPVSFDLMQQQRRRGDRSRRLDDRFLFLEAMLACRKHLHISWVGRDIRDDSELPPSILVSELRDYMAEAWLVSGDEKATPTQAAEHLLNAMTQQHPLQAFNPRYFGPEPTSYAKLWADCLNPIQHPQAFAAEPLTAEPVEWVELSQLEAMFTKPCEQFLQRQLGIYFDPQFEEELDAEPFELNSLEAWQLKQQALQASLSVKSSSEPKRSLEFTTTARYSGALPVAEAGELVLQQSQESIQSLALLVQQIQQETSLQATASVEQEGSTEQEELRVKLESMGIYGSVLAATPISKLRFYAKPGHLQGRDLMRAWLRHLLAAAALDDQASMWVIDSEQGQVLKPVPQQAAQTILTGYLALYRQGLTQPLPLFIRSAFQWMQMKDQELTPEQELQAMHKEWLTGFSGIPGEGDDPYIQRCYPELEPVLTDLKRLSEQLLEPFIEYSEQFEVRKRQSHKVQHKVLFERLEQLQGATPA